MRLWSHRRLGVVLENGKAAYQRDNPEHHHCFRFDFLTSQPPRLRRLPLEL